MRRSLSSGLTPFVTRAFALVVLASIGCHFVPNPGPTVVASLQEVHTDITRAGRLVAISVNASNAQLAIGASESGGLFRTTDRGNTWQHVDALEPFRMVDVAFAEQGSSNSQVVIATTRSDARIDSVTNSGGVWRSTDAGVTWTHVTPPAGCRRPFSAHGIAFSGANQIFVAADCGLLASNDLGGSWTLMLPNGVSNGVSSVVAQPLGVSTLVDVCLQNQRHRRSVDGGATWRLPHIGPSCDGAHTIAVSPRDTGVLFATMGTGLSESDDGGATWTNQSATSYNERPVWVRTRLPIDLVATHFDLYFPGRRAVCTGVATGLRCPSNAGEVWPRVPASPLNHDINGIAFDPGGNCPAMMVADYGVYRPGPATAIAPCGVDAAWVHVGRASVGLGSLQIYQITGQLHYPITGSGFTNLFMGTQDNLLWVTSDAGGPGWVPFGVEGSFLQTPYAASIAPAGDLKFTYMEFGSHPAASQAILPNVGNGTWSAPAAFTSMKPPGSGTAPVLVSPHTYVQWSTDTLFLTDNGGTSWSPIAVLPANPVSGRARLAINGFGASRMTRTPAGPAMYEFVSDGARFGVVLITRLTTQPTPGVAELRSFDGHNGQGFSSGMTHIAGYCFEPGAWYCDAIYAADPNDYRNLIAADATQGGMIRTDDAGRTWHTLFGLTSLVTDGGTLTFDDGNGNCQAHVIAYDPGNSAHVLVGTDRAGIIASANGGLTWRALPNTRQATGISSIFFDDRTNVIYVATYGRGLWKLTVDWTTVVP